MPETRVDAASAIAPERLKKLLRAQELRSDALTLRISSTRFSYGANPETSRMRSRTSLTFVERVCNRRMQVDGRRNEPTNSLCGIELQEALAAAAHWNNAPPSFAKGGSCRTPSSPPCSPSSGPRAAAYGPRARARQVIRQQRSRRTRECRMLQCSWTCRLLNVAHLAQGESARNVWCKRSKKKVVKQKTFFPVLVCARRSN